jgi:AraC-like DNA-binding protein
MLYKFSNTKLNSLFILTDNVQRDTDAYNNRNDIIKFLWNKGTQSVRLSIDGITIELEPDQLTTVTYFHKVTYLEKNKPLTGLMFNREFYCIADHDKEIGCNGILFFGTQDLPLITLNPEKKEQLKLLWAVIINEFKETDNIQGEMLQMLLKRFIILCTRLAKEQLITTDLKDTQIDTIRQYNVLVDIHFREKRKVKDYAELLHKSPKTLSNLFAIYNQKSPQLIIQERVVLEAKRLLEFTDKQNQEIASDLGFDDPAHFSKYFKKIAQMTPTKYKEKKLVR